MVCHKAWAYHCDQKCSTSIKSMMISWCFGRKCIGAHQRQQSVQPQDWILQARERRFDANLVLHIPAPARLCVAALGVCGPDHQRGRCPTQPAQPGLHLGLQRCQPLSNTVRICPLLMLILSLTLSYNLYANHLLQSNWTDGHLVGCAVFVQR